MSHEHDHAAENNYFLDQLCSVAACAALGIISILMFTSGKLYIILAPQFHWPVLIGGVLVLAMALYRGVDLWKQAGQVAKERAEHEHHHHHHHDHDHAECDHKHADCGHDHDHSWMPVKYAFLMLPIVVFLLGLPREGFSNDMLKKQLGNGVMEGAPKEIANKGTDLSLGFRELSEAAYNESKQKALEGKTVKLRGMFMKLRDKEFTLFKIRMRCCAADAIPMQVRIISPVVLNRIEEREWVEAKGQLQFVKLAGQNKVIPVVIVENGDDIKKIPAEPTEFDY